MPGNAPNAHLISHGKSRKLDVLGMCSDRIAWWLKSVGVVESYRQRINGGRSRLNRNMSANAMC
jgi:hypothetical protein